MKCLLLRSIFCWSRIVKNQYVDFHNVDENNHFFRKLFTSDNVSILRKYFLYDHFWINRRDEKNHDFLSHYQLGGTQPIEDKPLKKKTIFDENLKSYCVKFLEHRPFYNFYNSWEVVSEFLTVFEKNFIPNADLRQSRFKCSFTIVNPQPTPRDGFCWDNS